MNVHALPALLLAAALVIAACSTDVVDAPATTVPAASAPVEVQAVTTEALARELSAVGSLQSDEAVIVRPEIAGRVVRIGFDEGRPVASDQLLFALDDSVQRAEVDEARATLELAGRGFARADELFARKLVSQSDRDQAAANLELARAAVALAQARLDKTRIVAPFAGIAGLKQVSPGDYVVAGQDLVNLESIHPLKLDFRVDESALPLLRVGQPVEVETDAYAGEHFTGAVYAIDPRITEATRSIALRATLPNSDARLRPGQFARVRLRIGEAADAVVIPEAAIFPRGQRQFVYVVEDGRARLREVRIGQRRPGHAEVLSGLTPGESLVVSGLQRLGDGAAVRQQ